MLANIALWGALAGAFLAIVWLTFGGGAVGLVLGLAAAGWLLGMVFQRPDVLIGWLERLRDR